jgi:hypothetical protein
MSAYEPQRAMASWFLDKNHVVIPVIKHRLCLDYFLHNVSWIFSLAVGLFGVYATLFATGSSPYLFVVAVLGVASIPWLWFGEWAMGERLAPLTYAYMAGLWWYIVALLWAGSASYVHIRQGQEFIEETWYEMQAQVLIPFTTQLDLKRSLAGNSQTLFGLCVVTALIHLHSLGEAWKSLGGMMRMVQLKFAVFLPDFVPLFILAAGAASYSAYGGYVAAYATDASTAVLLWHSASCLLVLLAVVLAFAARCVWGITFASHAVVAVLFLPLAFVVGVTSLVIQSRALGVDAYVQANWDSTLVYLVPPQYSALPWDKYAEAAQTPLRQAAMMGVLLTVLLVVSSLLHIRCASVLLSVGPELYVARARLEALQEELAAKLALSNASYANAVDIVLGDSGVRGGLPANSDAADATATANPVAGVRDWASSSSRDSTSSRLTFSRSSDPGTPLRASTGGYGALDDGSSAAGSRKTGFAPVSVEGAGGGKERVSSSSSSAAAGAYSAPGGGYHDEDGGDGSFAADDALAAKAAAVSANLARTRSAAGQQYTVLMSMYERQLADLSVRVASPSCGTYWRGVSYGLGQAAATHGTCMVAAAALVVIALGSIGGGLAPIGLATTCGVLGRSPATRSFSTTFSIESGTPRSLFGEVLIENYFPFGAIEFEVDHVPVSFAEDRSHRANITITALAADEGDLPSAADLASYLNLTDNVALLNDDDTGGYLYTTVRLVPPPDAVKKCLGMKVRFSGAVGLMFVTIRSDSALVNITGNADDLAKNNLIFAYQTLNVRTNSAPIVINNGYIDRLGLDPVAGFPSSTVLTSNTGDIWLKLVSTSGLTASTAGTIHSMTLGSFSGTNCAAAICGDVYLTTTGYGKIVLNQAFGAYNAYISTEHGDIVATNTGQVIGLTLHMTSVDGNIVISNMLQVRRGRTGEDGASPPRPRSSSPAPDSSFVPPPLTTPFSLSPPHPLFPRRPPATRPSSRRRARSPRPPSLRTASTLHRRRTRTSPSSRSSAGRPTRAVSSTPNCRPAPTTPTPSRPS